MEFFIFDDKNQITVSPGLWETVVYFLTPLFVLNCPIKKKNSELIRLTHLTTVYVDYYRCEQLAQYKSVHPISLEHCTAEKHRLPIYIHIRLTVYVDFKRVLDKALLRSTYTVSALEVKLKSRGNFLTLLAACNMILRHRNSVHEITLIFLAKTNQNHDIFSLESSSQHIL